MNENFWTADTHFFHFAIARHCPNRPWKNVTRDNMEEHDEGMTANWNSVVGRGDTVRILGDFAWKFHNKFLSRLNGKKILILGNHDKMSEETRKNFTDVLPAGSRTSVIKIDGREFYASHYPHRTWYKSHYGVPNLFGHTHGRLITFNMSFDCGVDTKLAGLKPIHHNVVLGEVERRRQLMEAEGRIKIENGKKLYMQDDVMFWMNKFNRLNSAQVQNEVVEDEGEDE